MNTSTIWVGVKMNKINNLGIKMNMINNLRKKDQQLEKKD